MQFVTEGNTALAGQGERERRGWGELPIPATHICTLLDGWMVLDGWGWCSDTFHDGTRYLTNDIRGHKMGNEHGSE